MKVENLYIISTQEDAQVKGSARGFLYKYMMNNNAKTIFVYEFSNGKAVLETCARKQDGGGWQLTAGATANNQEDAADAAMPTNEFTKFAEIHLANVNESLSPSKKTYKTTHANGAIIICHASSMALANTEPELFAQNLIACTKTAESETAPFPIFPKIVFNACKAAKYFEKASELETTNFWEAGKKKIGNGKKAPEVNVAIFKQAGKQEDDDENRLTRPAHQQEIILKEKFFNPVFRFLNIYGRHFNKDIIVAGYDVALTAADMSKSSVDNTITEFEKLKTSGRKMLLEAASTKPLGWVNSHSGAPEHKFFYKFTASDGNVSAATLVPVGWSEWTDQNQ